MTDTEQGRQPLGGQVALITGGARGIRAAAAIALAPDGASVVLADLLDCAPACAVVTAAGGSATGHALDIRDRAACDRVVAVTLAEHGRPDMLVGNAGVCPPGLPVSDQAQWDAVINVNLNGTRNTIRAPRHGTISSGRATGGS